MDENIKKIFEKIGIQISEFESLENLIIPRETLLDDNKYDEIRTIIPDLKKQFSSTTMTSLQKTADKNQKWPLVNLIRQILHKNGYEMEPIRKCDGYTLDKIKKYKRFFICKKVNHLEEKPNTFS
jgi:DNA-dependent RNA polymerase auxiliary subunit epsilon